MVLSPGVTVTACLIVRDEVERLPVCLESLRSVIDEIVVIDTGSTDRTVDRARAMGARVAVHPWDDDFSAARNAALDRATGDWILTIDADEIIEPIEYEVFRSPLKNSRALGFLPTLVNRLDGGDSSVRLLRLFRNRADLRYTGFIHERLEPAVLRAATDPSSALRNHPARIIHTGYREAVRREKNKDERDIRLLKKQLDHDPSDPFYWYKLAVHPFARRHMQDEVARALTEAWTRVSKQDPNGSLYAFTAEVAALYLMDALNRQDQDRLIEAAARAARIENASPNLDYALGMAFLLGLNLDRASRHIERALSRDGNVLPYAPIAGVTSHRASHALSEIRFLQGRHDESADFFQTAISCDGSEPANTFHGSAKSLVEHGDPRWAIDLLTRAVQSQAVQPIYWRRGAEILAALGLSEPAERWAARYPDRECLRR